MCYDETDKNQDQKTCEVRKCDVGRARAHDVVRQNSTCTVHALVHSTTVAPVGFQEPTIATSLRLLLISRLSAAL